MQTNAHFQLPTPSPLERLQMACGPVEKLGWRNRRDASLQINAALLAELPEDKAFEVAEAVTGIKPENWLASSEAEEELRRLGITRHPRFLYRLADKARLAPDRTITAMLNSAGNWVNENGTFAITVRCDKSIKYFIQPIAG